LRVSCDVSAVEIIIVSIIRSGARHGSPVRVPQHVGSDPLEPAVIDFSPLISGTKIGRAFCQ